MQNSLAVINNSINDDLTKSTIQAFINEHLAFSNSTNIPFHPKYILPFFIFIRYT